MQYRSEIDGIRAIAVLAVIFFHAGFSAFGGGFVGVDIFIVISGYLITTIIHSELKSQTFSFVKFYARRVGRIIPPLFLVMFVSIPFAYFYFLPIHLKEFARSLIYIPLFVSNIFFMKQSGYFDSDVEIKPMIHTWSLAIEEQYYLLFPALLFLIYKLNKKLTFPILILSALASFLIIFLPYFDLSASYYLLPTRAWELLIGASLAIYVLEFKVHENNKIELYLSFTGIVLIAYSIFFIDRDQQFPGLIALVPTIGTALILYSSAESNFVNRLLSSKLLVGIGLISYSFYLWHQPLFAFSRYVNLSEPSKLYMCFLIGVSLALSYLSWRFVEAPFRKFALTSRHSIFVFYLLAGFIFIAFGLWVQKEKGFLDRFQDLKDLRVAEVHCTEMENDVCIFYNEKSSDPTVAVFGDSHAIALMPMLEKALGSANRSYVFSARHACPPLLGVHNLKESRTNDQCYIDNENRIDYIKSHPSIKKVFLVSRWSTYTDGNYDGNNTQFLGENKNSEHNKQVSRKAFVDAFGRTIDAYNKLGIQVYVVHQVPVQLVNTGQYYYFAKRRVSSSEDAAIAIYNKSVPLSLHNKLQKFSREVIENFESRQLLKVIKLDSLFCDNYVCRMAGKDGAYYYDKDHLSPLGAELAMPIFSRVIDEK